MQDISDESGDLYSALTLRANCSGQWVGEADGCAGLEHDPTDHSAVFTEQRLMMSNSNLHQQAHRQWQLSHTYDNDNDNSNDRELEICANAHETRNSISLISYAGCLCLLRNYSTHLANCHLSLVKYTDTQEEIRRPSTMYIFFQNTKKIKIKYIFQLLY